ncbi:hypothetical protein AURDEDRAFT_164361 [Auricularia subglabra TFB-10046 SS5]|nr:hypothetical protein AURDEDRAFT_164361 [Auricularia subglabra TFB-10046 SS5]
MFDQIADPNLALLLAGIFQALGHFDRVLAHSKLATGGSMQNVLAPAANPTVNFLELDQLAPCYGVLKSEAIRNMDAELQVAIGGTARVISLIPPEQRTWDKIMEALKQNPVLEPIAGSDIDRADTYHSDRRNWLKKTPEYDIVLKEARAWLTKLIVDPDILKQRAEIDLDIVAKVVSHASSTIDGLKLFAKDQGEKKVLDIGILRYPDVDNPFIKVYRISLLAWYDSRVVVGRAHDRNGISGEFNVRLFKPRGSVIKSMQSEAKDQAVAEANKLFRAQ